jgi:hypothetical protein
MLRRPSESHPTRRGDGCSSTAVDKSALSRRAVWNNLANRGSARRDKADLSAVP